VGNDGTNAANDPSRPSLTLLDAIASASNGDTIYVDTGIYGDDSLVINKQITIIGAGTGNTVFDNNNGAHNFGNITVSNVVIKNMKLTKYFLDSSTVGQTINISGSISGILLENLLITNNFGAGVSLPNINITGGANVIIRSTLFKCSGYNGNSGGGIRVNGSTLLVESSLFYNNENNSGIGGALHVTGATSNVTVTNCTFFENQARMGGSIGINGGTLTVSGSCFTNNRSLSGTNREGGGAIYAALSSTVNINNCSFDGNLTTNNELFPNGSADGGAICLNGYAGTFTIDTCSFSTNTVNNSSDDGSDIFLDEGSPATVSIVNCTFGNDGNNRTVAVRLNIFNNDLEAGDISITNSGALINNALNQDGIDGNNYSYSGTLPSTTNSNVASGLPSTTCFDISTITSCADEGDVNCATEGKAPLIIKCVDNKVISDCSGNLPNYTSEVSAYDDCFYTITQSPAPGTTLASLGNGVHTITMTVSDQSPNSPHTTCTFTITLSDCTITCSDTTTWNGDWSNGAPTETKSAIFTTNYTAFADVFACSVTISDNAVVTIPSGFDCTVSRDITVNTGSSFVFENTANLLQLTATATNTGNIIMTRNSNSLFRLDYTGWSSPVASQNLLSFSPNTLTNRFYIYNSDTNLFNRIATPGSTNFDTGVGYLIRIPNTHPTTPATVWSGVFQGVPNNGDYSVTMGNFGVGQRYNLVGNPYPSPIDMVTFVADNSANITGSIYFWRKTNSIVTTNRWSSWNNGVYVAADEPFTSNPNGIIRNGQGFLVEALGSATNLVFNNGMRVSNNQNLFFRTANPTVNNNEDSRIWLNLTNSTGEFYQQAISYTARGTDSVDSFDAKNFSNATTMLNSMIPNSTDYYVIQSRSLPFSASDVIPLSLNVGVPAEYTISIFKKDGLFTDPNQAIYLTDNYLNTCVNLNEGLYSFTSAVGNFDDRFELRYTNSVLSTNDNTFLENDVTVYINKDKQLVVNSNRLLYTISVYDVLGKLHVYEKANNSNQVAIDISSISNQLLLVKITDANGMVVSKKIIK
jgi:hypothetical protein